MASIASLVGAANNADLSAYTTAAFTPQAGDYLVCDILASGSVTTGTITDTQNLGWTLIGSVNDGTNILMMYSAQRTASAQSMTVTWDCTADPATGARVGVVGIRTSDATVRQFATGSGAGGTAPTVTLPAAALTFNALFGQMGNTTNPAAITPTTGWTEIADAGWNTPTTGFQIQRINSGETNSVIAWASNSATAWLAMVVEFWDTTDAPGAQPHNYIDGTYGMVN